MNKLSRTLTLASAVIFICLITAGWGKAASTQPAHVVVCGSEIDYLVEQGVLWVPLRATFNAVGATVNYMPDTRSVAVHYETFTFTFTMGSTLMLADHYPVELDQPIIIRSGRAFVAVHCLEEVLGCEAEFDPVSGTFTILSCDPPDRPSSLPTINTVSRLEELLKQTVPGFGAVDDIRMQMDLIKEAPGSDYSKTNLQVAGVDEADIAKTDGSYIYYVSHNQVVVVKAVPADQLQLTAELKLDEDFVPSELYVDDTHLVVIGNKGNMFYPMLPMPDIYPSPTRDHSVAIAVFDITDKQNITLIRELELSGRYLSSRKIGSDLYVMASQPCWPYLWFEDGEQPSDAANILPWYKDTVTSEERTMLELTEVHYFPGFHASEFLVIAGIQLDRQQPAHVSAFLGAGENVYASLHRLYVAVTRYQPHESYSPLTYLYRFDMDSGKVTYSGLGSVPGRIINQFAMDEHDGYFRIATTTAQSWQNTANNVFILGDNLNIVSSIKDMAPGEIIYSVRFAGARGYVVTFQTIDPLFVIDLDPNNPAVSGELKIPGFSTYLHPVDNNHIVGFGRETVEVTDAEGPFRQLPVIELGLKVSLFDISDVANPLEKDSIVIGGRGTESEILYNHKALLIDPQRELMAFPITVRDHKDQLEYGNTIFQGAYLLGVSPNKITINGKLTHFTAAELADSPPYNKHIERILYINDYLYTLSPGMIKAFTGDQLTETASINIK